MSDILRTLEKRYGKVRQRGKPDPWQLVVWINVGYLVPDERRAVAFRRLEREVGFDPKRILACDPQKLARIIEEGGMLAEHRAEKVRDCARIAEEVGLGALRKNPEAHLKKFPSIGEPGADRILLWMHRKKSLAPTSNGLRVLARLGIIKEHANNYAKTYKEVMKLELPRGWDKVVALHTLLETHGQSTCTRKAPACRSCPFELECKKVGL